MTHEQRQLVRQTLDLVREDADAVALLLYGRLFELNSATRPLFHNDLVAQGRKLIDTLEAVAASLDRLEAIRPRLIELGRRHADYGVRPEYYETLISAMLWTFAQVLGPDFDARARDAWRAALTAVADVMKEGAAVPR
jgi:hemoglobin-like flavoprotein